MCKTTNNIVVFPRKSAHNVEYSALVSTPLQTPQQAQQALMRFKQALTQNPTRALAAIEPATTQPFNLACMTSAIH